MFNKKKVIVIATIMVVVLGISAFAGINAFTQNNDTTRITSEIGDNDNVIVPLDNGPSDDDANSDDKEEKKEVTENDTTSSTTAPATSTTTVTSRPTPISGVVDIVDIKTNIDNKGEIVEDKTSSTTSPTTKVADTKNDVTPPPSVQQKDDDINTKKQDDNIDIYLADGTNNENNDVEDTDIIEVDAEKVVVQDDQFEADADELF